MASECGFYLYVNDWNIKLNEHPLEIEGAWIRICCILAKSDGKATKNLQIWSRILSKNRRKTLKILLYLQQKNIATIEPNPLSTDLDSSITIISRKLVRYYGEREGARKRQANKRERDSLKKDQTTPDVTPNVTPPSPDSLPFPSSSPPKKDYKPTTIKEDEKIPAPPESKPGPATNNQLPEQIRHIFKTFEQPITSDADTINLLKVLYQCRGVSDKVNDEGLMLILEHFLNTGKAINPRTQKPNYFKFNNVPELTQALLATLSSVPP